jgi:RNA polymerase sigma factor (sigma-70 family)
MGTVSLPAARIAGPRSKRLLALAGDDRLVERIRAGDELAFEVAYERHSAAVLSFCRHMLRSREEAEDALQHTFASAYRAIGRDDREIRLKPWLFAIARNRCLSTLRARREDPAEEHEIPTSGLAEQVEQRHELRDFLRDLDDLPEQQREALLLAEVSGLAHREVADVIGCKPHKVKALVFRARSGLMERREARETPCAEIREQLANLSGGSLRRSGLHHHLRMCEGCRDYREQVKRQRRLLAAVLPVIPSAGLKESVLAAIGLGGGAASGGAGLAKLAIVGALAAGGTVAGDAVVTHQHRDDARSAPEVRRLDRAPSGGDARATLPVAAVAPATPAAPRAKPANERAGGRAAKRHAAHRRARAHRRAKARRHAAARAAPVARARVRSKRAKAIPPGQAKKTAAPKSKSVGHEKQAAKPAKPIPPARAKKVAARESKPPKEPQPANLGKGAEKHAK